MIFKRKKQVAIVFFLKKKTRSDEKARQDTWGDETREGLPPSLAAYPNILQITYTERPDHVGGWFR